MANMGAAVCPKCFRPFGEMAELNYESGHRVHLGCDRRYAMMIGFDPVTKEPRAVAALHGDKTQDAIFVSDCEIKGLRVELRLHTLKDTDRILKQMGL